MSAVIDFLAGRSNRLLRDILTASAIVTLTCVSAVGVLRAAVDSYRAAPQALPARVAAEHARPGTIRTITRSVLDDPVTTGSVSGRSLRLDPCTGKAD